MRSAGMRARVVEAASHPAIDRRRSRGEGRPEGGRENHQDLRPRLYRLSIEGADGEQNGSGCFGDSRSVGGFGRLHGYGRSGEGRAVGGGGLRAAAGGYAAEDSQASGAAAKHNRLLAAQER